MAGLGVLLIILGCATYLYLKGTTVKSFAAVIITICASAIAFTYFEVLANVFISRGYNSRYPTLTPWVQPLAFVSLFVLTFAILRTIASRLTRQPVDLGPLPERIGRIVCGIFLGLLLSGLLLTVLAMAPLPNKYPYQRFDSTRPDPEKPRKVLFNVDGFATACFSVISNGSFSGKKSFASLHPDFPDQAFLNRHNVSADISIVTGSQAIEVPRKKNAAWYAPEGLKSSTGKPLPPRTGHTLTIVRVEIKKSALRESGKFTLSQLRLICKQKHDAENPLVGNSRNIYPLGYVKTANLLQLKNLDDKIELQAADFEGPVRAIDFAFYVPNDFQPVLLEFKQNGIARVPPPVSGEQAPPPAPFVQMSNCGRNSADLNPVTSADVYGVELATGTRLLEGLTLEISDPNHWRSSQTSRSIKPAQFEGEQINCVRAELKVVEPPKDPQTSSKKAAKKDKKVFSQMLKPRHGYELLSLRCNKPPTGKPIRAQQLPVLVELSGPIHRPVGVIASGKVAGQTVYEVDYCSLAAEQVPDGLVFDTDGLVATPFPNTVWLTEKADSIREFYTLYLVRSDRKAIIIGVRPGDSQTTAGFKKYEGFLVK